MVHLMSSQVDVRRVGLALTLSGVLTMLAAISWIWIDENRESFPIPTTDAGRDLALTYNVISHAIFISILIIAVGWMSWRIRQANHIEAKHNDRKTHPTSHSKTTTQWLWHAIQKHPFSTGLFTLYSSYVIQTGCRRPQHRMQYRASGNRRWPS